LVFVAFGCGDNGSREATPTTRSSVTTSSTTTVADERGAVANAYRAADKANLDAAAIPDPEFPALLATHTGPMLEQRQKVLKAFELQGLVGRLPANSKYRNVLPVGSMRVTGDVAVFDVCAVDDSERVEKASGKVVGGGLNTVLIEVAMQRVSGSWKLAERKELDRWTGEAGCAAP
jgi:hypothetical protein